MELKRFKDADEPTQNFILNIAGNLHAYQTLIYLIESGQGEAARKYADTLIEINMRILIGVAATRGLVKEDLLSDALQVLLGEEKTSAPVPFATTLDKILSDLGKKPL